MLKNTTGKISNFFQYDDVIQVSALGIFRMLRNTSVYFSKSLYNQAETRFLEVFDDGEHDFAAQMCL